MNLNSAAIAGTGIEPAPFWSYPDLDREVYRRVNQIMVEMEMWDDYGRVSEDPDHKKWNVSADPRTERTIGDLSRQIQNTRAAVMASPYFKRALKLYEIYVFGSDFRPTVRPLPSDEDDDLDPTLEPGSDEHKTAMKKQWERQRKQQKVKRLCDRIFTEALEANPGFDYRELGERTYRDGEAFVRTKYDQWPPAIRFIDPEEIGDPAETSEDDKDKGIITDPNDSTVVLQYRWIDDQQKWLEDIPAEEMTHCKIDCDSTEKRGRTRFAAVLEDAPKIDSQIETERVLRKNQASIAMNKIVPGRPTGSEFVLLDNNAQPLSYSGQFNISNDRVYQPGSIMTSPKGAEVTFSHPTNNFSDASPLIALLIRRICAVTGWTYAMISADSDSGNFANALIHEGPVHQMVLAERAEFKPWLVRLATMILAAGFEAYREEFAELEIEEFSDLFTEFEITHQYPNIVPRDPLKEAQTATSGIMNGSISVAEGSRIMNKDPEQMKRERAMEMHRPDVQFAQLAAQNPNTADKAASSSSNAQDGAGSNQGDNTSTSHSDAQGVRGSDQQ